MPATFMMRVRGRRLGAGTRWPAAAWVCGLVIIGCLPARAALDAGPRLVCDAPEYAFGDLENTNVVAHTFVLRNEGDATLVIGGVKPDCGCTQVRLEAADIPPGEDTTLSVTLTLQGRHGSQRKRITLECNDPTRPRVVLQLVGTTYAEAEIQPERLYWGPIHEQAAPVKAVGVTFHEERLYRVTAVTCSVPFFAVEAAAFATGGVQRVTIAAVPPLPRGAFACAVTVATDHPHYPVLTLPMQGRVVGDCYTIPDEIVVAPDTAHAVTRKVLVHADRPTPFQILSVTPPATNIEVRVRPVSSGYKIELRQIVGAPELDGRELVIVTDLATTPELRVPFRVRAWETNAAAVEGTAP